MDWEPNPFRTNVRTFYAQLMREWPKHTELTVAERQTLIVDLSGLRNLLSELANVLTSPKNDKSSWETVDVSPRVKDELTAQYGAEVLSFAMGWARAAPSQYQNEDGLRRRCQWRAEELAELARRAGGSAG